MRGGELGCEGMLGALKKRVGVMTGATKRAT